MRVRLTIRRFRCLARSRGRHAAGQPGVRGRRADEPGHGAAVAASDETGEWGLAARARHRRLRATARPSLRYDPGRPGAALADWLWFHPGVEIIVRGRADAYADHRVGEQPGGRPGPPPQARPNDPLHMFAVLGSPSLLVKPVVKALLGGTSPHGQAREPVHRPHTSLQ